MPRGIPNPFKIGLPIYRAAIGNRLLPYVAQYMAERGWSDNTIITRKVSKALYQRHVANIKMLAEHGNS